MIQLAYVSSTTGLLTVEEIARILVVSRENNSRQGITGLLVYKGGNVLQVLEGERDAVLSLYAKIRNDTRHDGVITLYTREIAGREFPQWSMGFHEVNDASARQLEGFSEVLHPGFDLCTLKASSAAKLLACFRNPAP